MVTCKLSHLKATYTSNNYEQNHFGFILGLSAFNDVECYSLSTSGKCCSSHLQGESAG
jgi:hypothetical protein